MDRSFGYPVWGTQGGGLVREVNGMFIFVQRPGCPSLDVGDEMPREWGLAPANSLAREEQAMFEEDLDLLFEGLFDRVEVDKFDLSQVDQFLPEGVRGRNV